MSHLIIEVRDVLIVEYTRLQQIIVVMVLLVGSSFVIKASMAAILILVLIIQTLGELSVKILHRPFTQTIDIPVLRIVKFKEMVSLLPLQHVGT